MLQSHTASDQADGRPHRSRLLRLFRANPLVKQAASARSVTFDRNTLDFFAADAPQTQLYRDGLVRSGCEWSDNFHKQCRFFSLQQMVATVIQKQIPGDFAECGCWKGHSTYIISHMLAESGFEGRIHVFDSFEGGLSDKAKEDHVDGVRQSDASRKKEKAHFASTEAEVRSAVSEFSFVDLYKGWIPTRFVDVDDRQFAMVHVDVDLFEPTRDSLQFFYPRLAAGGVIVVDDYGYTCFPGAKQAVDEFLANNEHSLFYMMPMGGCFIVK